MRALVLGSQSFIDGGPKVGTQYLAQALAAAGWQVDYLPTLSSPFDLVGRKRHARLSRAWGGQGASEIAPGLTEWSAKALFPAHRLFLRMAWQARCYGLLLPTSLRRTRFDVCLTDVAPNMLLVPQIAARVHVCRLNDWPQGFAEDLHPVAIEAMVSILRGPVFSEVWAVSGPLQDYSRQLNPRLPVLCLPNGVDAGLLMPAGSRKSPRRECSAVYIGAMTAWFDRALLCEVAALMPDWSFDIYGPGGASRPGDPPNLHWRGGLSRERLVQVLPSYEVGLIPFCDPQGRMRYVERPLKFYEYIAAGLGVACTDLGALRGGMAGWACFGNGPKDFAQAIRQARLQASTRSPYDTVQFVQENAWHSRAQAMLERMDTLLA